MDQLSLKIPTPLAARIDECLKIVPLAHRHSLLLACIQAGLDTLGGDQIAISVALKKAKGA